MTPKQHLVLACCSLVLLTAIVGIRMLLIRIKEMKQHKIHPQSISLSTDRAEKLQDTRASDNFNHLFEIPVLFYTLCGISIACAQIPSWLPAGAWLFVILRFIHSYIQCTYNKVMHRFNVFLAGFFLLIIMWLAFSFSLLIS